MSITEAAAAHVVAAYSLIVSPGDIVEIRAANVPGRGQVSGYFDNVRDFVSSAASLNGCANAWMSLNPVIDDVKARSYNLLKSYAKSTTTDNEIARRKWMLIDVDSKRPKDISATNEEHDAALATTTEIREYLWQLAIPSAMFDSGNGAHLLVPVDLPNDESSSMLMRRFIKALSDRFSTDRVDVDKSTFNAARVTKLYGTWSMKGSNLPDRPHRNSLYLHSPQSMTTDIDALIRIAGEETQSHSNRYTSSSRSTFDMEAYLQEHNIEYLESRTFNSGLRWSLATCPFNPNHRAPDAAVFLVNGIPSFRCLHNSCAEFSWNDFRRKVEDCGSVLPFDMESVDRLFGPPIDTVPVAEAERPEIPFVEINDIALADRMIRVSNGNLFYFKSLGKWIEWNGRVWQEKDDFEIQRYARETILVTQRLIDDIADQEVRGRLTRLLASYKSERAVKAMISLAKASLIVTGDMLNIDPWLFNLQNGILDLRTGELRPHDRRCMMTMISPVFWNGIDAQCPQWERHLRYFLPEPGVVQFLQSWYGYCMTGETRERKMVIIHGVGSNGKSITQQMVARILGDYAKNAPSDLVMQKRDPGVSNDVARLQGARLIYMSESDANKRLAESKVKEWTGKDMITARFLHKEFFSYLPNGKLQLSTNNRPLVAGTDHAIWSRLISINFGVTIPDQYKRNHDEVESEFWSESSGILAWAVRGCIWWQQHGLVLPHEIQQSSIRYRDDMDMLGQFIGDICECSEEFQCDVVSLYSAYKSWCSSNSEHPRSQRVLVQQLRERDYEVQQLSDGDKRLVGLRVRAEYQAADHLFRRP